MERIKKVSSAMLALVLVAVLVLALPTQADAASGTCGDGVYWDLTSGVLTISGSGAMKDFEFLSSATTKANQPWNSYASSITSVVIEDGVTYVGKWAFRSCNNITSIYLGKDVASMHQEAIYVSSGIRTYSVSAANQHYSVDSKGVLFNKDKTKLVLMPTAMTGTYEVPEGVKTIGYRAFERCHYMSGVVLPSSLRTIEDWAFYNHNGLKSITVPEGVTSIGNYAFAYCYNLKTVTLPSTLTSVGTSAFADTPWVENLPTGPVYFGTMLYAYNGDCPDSYVIEEGTTAIAGGAFSCGVSEITLPKSLKHLGANAFSGAGVDKVHVASWDQWFGLTFENGYANPLCQGGILYVNGKAMQNLVLPSNVSAIPAYGFYGSGITGIQFSGSIKKIGTEAFANCGSLASVHIGGGVTTIGTGAFQYCDSLAEVSMGSAVTTVGNRAFYGCEYLTVMKLGDNVTKVEAEAFRNCYDLDAVHFGKKAMTVEADAFTGCQRISEVYLSDLAAWLNSTMASCPLTSFGSGRDLFINGEPATHIVIPDGITEIRKNAFYWCLNIQSVDLNQVRKINTGAFSLCYDLDEMTVSDALTEISAGSLEPVYTLRIREGSTKVTPEMAAVGYYAYRVYIASTVTEVGSAFGNFKNLSHVYFLSQPTIAEDAFENITANVYTFTKWNEANKKNYGGSLTWNSRDPVIEPTDEVPYYVALNQELKGEWFVLSYFDINDRVIAKVKLSGDNLHTYDTSSLGKKTASVWAESAYAATILRYDYEYVVVDPADINSETFRVEAIDPMTFTGAPLVPDVKVYYRDNLLVEGRDYKLSITNNVMAGDVATVQVTGLGVFSKQSVSRNFAVLKKDISELYASLSSTSYTYTGKPIKPAVTVSYDELTLEEGRDYILVYANNVGVGTATVTIYGKGNYSGSVVKNFTISNGSSSTVNVNITSSGPIYVRDQTISIYTDSCLSGYTLYDSNGYVVDYSNIPSSAYSASSYIRVSMSGKAVGTYRLECKTQGYTMVVSGGRYIYKPTGSITTKTFTVYRQAAAGEVIPEQPTALTAGAAQAWSIRQMYLPVTVEPADAVMSAPVWTSSNPSVATVEDGIVTVLKAGKTTVTVTSDGLSATWNLNIPAIQLPGAQISGYDANAGTMQVYSQGELLVQGTDYTVAQTTVDGKKLLVISGCNLFTGDLLYAPNGSISGWVELEGAWYCLNADGNMVVSDWAKDGSKWCYLGEDGRMVKSKWVKDGTKWCYIDSTGHMVTSKWVKDGSKWCYIDAYGYMVTSKWLLDGSKWCYIDADGYMVTDKWLLDGSKWCYVGTDGYMVTNDWVKDGKYWAYVGADGYMVKNQWLKDGNQWVYVDKTGHMVTNGWALDGAKWRYMNQHGRITYSQWVDDGYGWCYVDSYGFMVTNKWVKDGSKWCYIGADGYMVKNQWLKDGNYWVYVNKSGYMVVNGWALDGAKWRFMDSNGRITYNKWVNDGYGWAYMGSDGFMVTNKWMLDGSKWCYIGSDGYMVTNGWAKDGSKWCYLGADGYMVYNKWVKDGSKWCYIGSDGYMATNRWIVTGVNMSYVGADGYAYTGTHTIGGKKYTFDANGNLIS